MWPRQVTRASGHIALVAKGLVALDHSFLQVGLDKDEEITVQTKIIPLLFIKSLGKLISN